MTLVSTPKNPVPLGANAGYLDVRKGVKVRYASWQSALQQRGGTVCIFPGRNEYIEKYFEVVGELRRRGFAVAILDWRGQGGSTRLVRGASRGHVPNFIDYEQDIHHFMKGVVLPDCPMPYYALGHSMSAPILFNAATKRGCWFHRLITTAPMVELAQLPVPREVCAGLAAGMSWVGLGKQAVPGDQSVWTSDVFWTGDVFEGNPLTSDRERFYRNVDVLDAAPGLAAGPPTIGWLHAAFDAMSRPIHRADTGEVPGGLNHASQAAVDHVGRSTALGHHEVRGFAHDSHLTRGMDFPKPIFYRATTARTIGGSNGRTLPGKLWGKGTGQRHCGGPVAVTG